jgi:hypothetical protein
VGFSLNFYEQAADDADENGSRGQSGELSFRRSDLGPDILSE